jgi:uncharacterized protein
MLELSGRVRRSSILLALDRSLLPAEQLAAILASDRSLRSVDADGHMRVEESRISKANICPYLGKEIPGWEQLGLDPEKTYRLFRDPEELKKGADTFTGKPLLITHVPVDADEPQKDLWVGTVGKVTWEDPYLVSRPLMVLTQEAIDAINSRKQRELSSAYRYDAVMEPGAWGGESYDGRMVNIRGNHVAIVSEGRAGPDVHVADALPPELRRMNRTLAATIATILAPFTGKLADPDKHGIAIALDGALGETPAESVISLDAAEMKACEDAALAEKKAEHGEDAELDDEDRQKAYENARDRKAKDRKAKDAKRAKDKSAKDRKAHDERESALDEREAAMDSKEEAEDAEKDDEEAKDRKRARDARKTARDKRAKDRGMDALPDPTDHRRDFRSGDAAVTKDEMNDAVKAAVEATEKKAREAAIARDKVRPLVGSVSVALDSAPEIYRFALKHAQVETKDVHDSALSALVDMAVKQKKQGDGGVSPSIALDAATAQLTNLDDIFRPKAA